MHKLIVGSIVGIIIVSGGTFYAGMKYDQTRTANARTNGGNRFANLTPEERQARVQQFGMGGGMGRGMLGSGFATGEVISKDDKSVTIKLMDGGSKIIFFTGNTGIMKSVSGSSADVIVGQQIVINGSANQDGSVNAQTIQIRSAQNNKTK